MNLTQLRFIDTSAAGVIVQTASGLTDWQRMTVRIPFDVLAALGLQELPRATMTAARHGD
ncbi:hypothetical protein ACFQO7_22100 [Catellatospora aurea]|uniref:STAS domain-containing protein n=1 Tax=Catellatospora aurea TaxID=1337874 RepID=A0ABW2GYS4_9ACTN